MYRYSPRELSTYRACPRDDGSANEFPLDPKCSARDYVTCARDLFLYQKIREKEIDKKKKETEGRKGGKDTKREDSILS